MGIKLKQIFKNKYKFLSSGFTLMEVLLALAILGFAVLAFSRMQITSIQTSQTAWEFTKAANLAANKIEFLTALDYDNSKLVSGSEKNSSYDIEWKIRKKGSMKNIKQIAVTVSWKEKKTIHKYILNSYMRKT